MQGRAGRPEKFSLDGATAGQLARAERRLGQIMMLARLWEPWSDFARGALVACSAASEVRLRGKRLDMAELLALGPEPNPSRPVRALRWGVGITLAHRRLESLRAGQALAPSLVSEIFHSIEAPHLSRGSAASREKDSQPVRGAAAWTLAPRWLSSGLPPLWAAGLALASWLREAPGPPPRRSLAGRVLMCGLAPRLGLPAQGFYLLGAGLFRAAAQEERGLEGLVTRVRRAGAWRRFTVVFLRGVELSAAQVVKLSLAARELYQGHRDLIDTWVRAPRHPKRLLRLLLERPVVELPLVASRLEVTQRTAGLLARKLEEQGLLLEITGQRRGRRFAYAPLLQLLQPGWGQKRGLAAGE